MSGLFNFLGKLFSGILGFVGGLFGGKKSGGYYLELEDAKGQGAVAPAAVAPAASKSKPAAATTQPPKVTEPVTDGKVAVSAATQVVEENVKSVVNEVKQVTTTKANKAKPVAPANTNNGLNLPEPKVTNFATDYLAAPTAAGRRRPGANMKSFLDMAKQVKTSG